MFTRESDAKRYYQAYFKLDTGSQTIYGKALSPLGYAALRYTIFFIALGIFFYSAILNTSRHTIFGGKLYPFNAYMIVACVHQITTILEVLIFSMARIDLEIWQSVAFQMLVTVGCLVWMARSSRLLVYYRIVPVYQVIAFINWSVGAFLVSVYFLPVSWLLYGLMYFGNKFRENTNTAYEWRLSVSVAIDFIGTILPFVVMKKGAMFYLFSRYMAFMYRGNLYFSVYTLMVLSVVPIAILRSKIVQYHLTKNDNFAQGLIASGIVVPETEKEQKKQDDSLADFNAPPTPALPQQ